MSLVVLENASLSFGGQPIFDQVNLTIDSGEQIGLVGPNGAGKSTLLRVLTGSQSLDQGRMIKAKATQIGYLAQHLPDGTDVTLLDSVLATVPGHADLDERIASIGDQIASSEDEREQQRLCKQLGTLQQQREHVELYFGEHHAARILEGLGFTQADFNRPLSHLSGGFRMRGALAALLFQRPDVLLLDEPTNHLDIPSVLWLDQFLAGFGCTTVLICHDRNFLNRHTQRVVSFEPEGVRSYVGNYEHYVEQRDAEGTLREAEFRSQQKRVKELERFVERFRAKATKARQAQSRKKQIERMQQQIQAPIERQRRLKFTFPPLERTGRTVVQLKDLTKALGGKTLYQNLTTSVQANERIAIVGPNGAGKTTLLRLIAGELAPDSGTVKLGHNVSTGYYSQHHVETLRQENTVLQEVWRVQPRASETAVRSICGGFLFSGDSVEKPVSVLSGGERARVLLAQLLANPGNLLLMDEPTNHLDIYAAEGLAEALEDYAGSLIFVSHDTGFINRLAKKIWVIDGGTLTEYPGNLDAYVEHLERAREIEKKATPAPDKSHQGVGPTEQRKARKEQKRREAEQRNAAARQTRALRAEITKIEQEIAQLEAEQQEIEPTLSDPTLYADKTAREQTLTRYSQNRDKLHTLYETWETRHLELDGGNSDE